MSKHLHVEINRFHNRLLTLSATVEKNLSLATRAIESRDASLAKQVIDSDAEIDRQEVDLEEEGLKILALYQPVAVDLRVIVATLKIVRDLERIGDLAVNIAKRAQVLTSERIPLDRFRFPAMMDRVTSMLRQSLDALVRQDAALARRVCEADTEVDEMNRRVREQVESALAQHSVPVNGLLQVLAVARHLERVADHATLIAEDVIYLTTAEIVRHRTNGTPAVPDTAGRQGG